LVGFVNGLPLVVIKLKKPGTPACAVLDENLTHYKAEIPQLFWFNARLNALNGLGLLHSRPVMLARFANFPDATTSRFNVSPLSFNRRWLARAWEHIARTTNETGRISAVKIAVGIALSAQPTAMLFANAVLPVPGKPATTIISPG